MRDTTGRESRVSIKLKAAVGALLAIFAFGAFGAIGAQAASTPGGPIDTDFNYVGINVTALGNELNELVLTPTTEDPSTPAPGDFLPPLKMNGIYTDTAGNFTLPAATGFDFPKLAVSIGPADIEAEIGLTEDASGNFNDATGAMNLDAKISLTLGTDNLEDIEGLPIEGEGPLKCQIAPLNVSMSTNPVNWPSAGSPFTDMTSAAPKEGAISGSWNTKPKVVSLITQNASLCPLIGGLLEPVGGLYLANSTPVIANLPAATAAKPAPAPCPAGTTGTPGTPPEDCKPIPPPTCPTGTTGTPPDCVIPPPAECEAGQTGTPPNCKDVVSGEGKLGGVKLSAPKKIKAGKKIKAKMTVKNSGDDNLTNVRMCLKTQKKFVKGTGKRCRVLSNLSPGQSKSVKFTLKTKKKKGKTTLKAVVSKFGTVKRATKKTKLK